MRVGLVSFAHMHAWSYATYLRKMAGVELVGVVDDDGARRAKIAAAMAPAPVWGDLASLLAVEPEAIVLCSENARHRELAEQALEVGVAVLCEKPLATTLSDARAMMASALCHGVALATAFPCRFHPAADRARRALAAGELGKLWAISATNHGQVPPGWFTDPRLSGGGAIMDHTVHVVDLIRWMTGQEVVSVFAEKGRLRSGLAVEDLGLLSMKLADGTVATLDASWSRPAFFPTWGDVTMEFIGAAGVMSLDLFAQVHSLYRHEVGTGLKPASWINWGDDMDRGLVADFIAAMREGRPPAVSGEDGLRALEVALAAYASIERGEPVDLPLEAGG